MPNLVLNFAGIEIQPNHLMGPGQQGLKPARIFGRNEVSPCNHGDHLKAVRWRVLLQGGFQGPQAAVAPVENRHNDGDSHPANLEQKNKPGPEETFHGDSTT